MRLAFQISAHTDPKQLHRLVNALPECADFYVHIDLKSNIDDFKSEVKNCRVCFIENRLNVVWGSLIEVSYQMELVRACLASGKQYDYLITLSGLDYPVWSNERIVKFFEEAQGKNILQGIRMQKDDPSSRLYQEYRFLNNYPPKSFLCRVGILCRKLLSCMGIRKPLMFRVNGKIWHLYKGAAWWAITPKLAKAVLDEWDNNHELMSYFKNSFGPAETFTQTVAFNTPEHATQCILSEGYFTSLQALTPLTYVEYPSSVKILTEEDCNKILTSGKMFCRKTVTGKSDKLMDMIDAHRVEKSAIINDN